MDEVRQEIRVGGYPAAKIRECCPNISMSFVAYLRSKNFITPPKIESPTGGHPSYLYSERDIELIIKIWEYKCKDGLRLDVAHKKALNEIEQPEMSFKQ